MNKIKILLLCNNKMAMPLAMRLVQEGALCGIVTPDKDKEVVQLYAGVAQQCRVPHYVVNKKEFAGRLKDLLREQGPDAVMVMTWPWRITEELLAIPPHGFINFHPGRLPQMRGADPIFESIRQQMPVAGITAHVMDAGYDTGPILLQETFAINGEQTYGMLARQMAYVAEQMAVKLLPKLSTGGWGAGSAQSGGEAKYWPRVGPEDLVLNWETMDSMQIKALVKACNPITKGLPALINGWKIGFCEVMEVNLNGETTGIEPGTIIAMDGQNGMLVYCRDNRALKIEVVYTEEGLFPGYKLAYFGIQQGMRFGTLD